jgi:hypothetical protein
MRGGGLLKLQFPLIPALHPHRTKVLIARRRALIFFGGLANDGIVGDDGSVVAKGHDFDVVGGQFQQAGIAKIVSCFLAFEQSAIDSDEREVLA